MTPIRNSPWIRSRNTAWQQILHLGQRRRYSRSEIIGGNGDYVDCLQYLYRGRIKLCRINSVGMEKILFHIEEGNLFGEVPFWSGQPMDSVFIAEEPCEVYAFSRQCTLNEIMTAHPSLIVNMLEGMANKSHILGNLAADVADLDKRVCQLLIHVADRGLQEKDGASCVTVKGISQQEMASMLGVHRVTINHAIGDLKRVGIIGEMTKSSLVILDYEKLLEIASR